MTRSDAGFALSTVAQGIHPPERVATIKENRLNSEMEFTHKYLEHHQSSSDNISNKLLKVKWMKIAMKCLPENDIKKELQELAKKQVVEKIRLAEMVCSEKIRYFTTS